MHDQAEATSRFLRQMGPGVFSFYCSPVDSLVFFHAVGLEIVVGVDGAYRDTVLKWWRG